MTGTLALVGGAEWRPACRALDAALLDLAGTKEVVVLPTAAAYEQPERAVETARAHFEALGATVVPVMALARPDAHDEALVAKVAGAGFAYLSGGSPLHLRSVLKQTPLWEALVALFQGGGVLAGSSAGAMVLGDPMVDPRGGAFTLGLGLLETVAVLPHLDHATERTSRTLRLAPAGVAVLGLPESTAALLDADRRSWSVAGAAPDGVQVRLDGRDGGVELLPS